MPNTRPVLYDRPGAEHTWPVRPASAKPRLGEAWGSSLRRALALREASGAPAGRGLSQLFDLVWCAPAARASTAVPEMPAQSERKTATETEAGKGESASSAFLTPWSAPAQNTRWLLSLRPAGAPEASLSARACLRLPRASASLGQSAGWVRAGRPHRGRVSHMESAQNTMTVCGAAAGVSVACMVQSVTAHSSRVPSELGGLAREASRSAASTAVGIGLARRDTGSSPIRVAGTTLC